jgi:hypothetical protein
MFGTIQELKPTPKSKNGKETQVGLTLPDGHDDVERTIKIKPLKTKLSSVTFAANDEPKQQKRQPDSQPLFQPPLRKDIEEDSSSIIVTTDKDTTHDGNKVMSTTNRWAMPTMMQQMIKSTPDQAIGLGNAVNQKSFLRQRREFSSRNKNDDHQSVVVGKSSVEHMEARARKMAIRNSFALSFLHFYAGVKILITYLITLDSVVGCILTAGMTCYWFFTTHQRTQGESNEWNGTLSFVLMTFAVVSPIIMAIRMAFNRREEALKQIASLRSNFLHIYLAHSLWDWEAGGGRAGNRSGYDFLEHCDGVLEQLIGMGDELARFLSLPNTSRGWNRTTNTGRAEAVRTVRAAYGLLESVTLQRMVRLVCLSEHIKKQGLHVSEMSRLRSFERRVSDHLERLRMLKMYRTPQALWAFGRVFTIVMPAFYGPAFAQVAHDLQSLWVGIAFGIITTLVLTALLEAVQVLEDPFTAYVSLDGVDVREEFEVLNFTQLVKARKLFFPLAPAYPLRARTALMGLHYDPFVHLHATEEEREVLRQCDVSLSLEEDIRNSERDTLADRRGGAWTEGISGSSQRVPRMTVWSD